MDGFFEIVHYRYFLMAYEITKEEPNYFTRDNLGDYCHNLQAVVGSDHFSEYFKAYVRVGSIVEQNVSLVVTPVCTVGDFCQLITDASSEVVASLQSVTSSEIQHEIEVKGLRFFLGNLSRQDSYFTTYASFELGSSFYASYLDYHDLEFSHDASAYCFYLYS